jgi:ADP-heptose:LPS heptosyltransferase
MFPWNRGPKATWACVWPTRDTRSAISGCGCWQQNRTIVPTVALCRNGSLGDIIMTFNFMAALQQHNEVHYFCHSSMHAILRPFVEQHHIITNFYPSELYNADAFDRTVFLLGYPLKDGYPHQPMRHHLLYSFAKELDVFFTFDGFSLDAPPLPALLKQRFDIIVPHQRLPYITLQVKTGWSAYKEWWGWQELVNFLKHRHPDIAIYQIGGPHDPQIHNVDGSFCGASFAENVAAQAWACAHLGLDSVLNHTTNIQWHGLGKTHSVILFGSTQADASGYPHNANISVGLPCQPCFRENPAMSTTPLGPCINPPGQRYEEPHHNCMRFITPSMVYEKVRPLLEQVNV